MLLKCKTKKEYMFKIRLIAFLTMIAIMIPLIIGSLFPAFAEVKKYCRECGAEIQMDLDSAGTPYKWTHPESDTCSHSKEYTMDPSADSLTWVWGTAGIDPSYAEEKEAADMAFGEAFIRSMLRMIFGSTSGSTEDYTSPISMLTRTFKYLAEDGGIIDGITSSSWYLFIVGASFIIMFFRFMSDYALEKMWEWDRQSTETLYRPFLKLVGGIIFILLLPYFLRFILYLSQAAIVSIRSNPFTADGTDTSTILKDAEDSLIKTLGFEKGGVTKIPQNMGAILQGVVVLAIPFLVANAANLGIFFICFSRVLEIACRAAIAPLAMSDIYKMGERSNGMQYLFGFFGICFQGFAILLVFFVSDYVSVLVIKEMIVDFSGKIGGDISGISTLTFFISAIALSKLVILFRTGQLAKSAFGGQ